MKGHANCVKFVKSFGKPTLVLGGGGYTMRNVARTWAYETGALIGHDLGPTLPYNDYYEYFAPDYELNVLPSNMDNANSAEYLRRVTEEVVTNLRQTGTPSVQLQDVPRVTLGGVMDSDAEDEADDMDADENPDAKLTQLQADKRIARDDEFYDSEDEDMNERNGIHRQPGQQRARNIGIMDTENPYADADIDVDENGDTVAVPGGTGMSGSGSREENKRIAEQKADAALSPNGSSSGSASRVGNGEQSRAVSGEPEADLDGGADEMDLDDEGSEGDDELDEDVEEVDAPTAPIPAAATTATTDTTPRAGAELTPPDSPVPAPVVVVAPSTTNAPVDDPEDAEMEDEEARVEAALAKEEGLAEREADNQEGEKKMEQEVARDAD
jgi:histone deacetylase 1/2